MPVVAILGQGSIGRRRAALLTELGCEVLTYDPFPTAKVPGTTAVEHVEELLGRAQAVVVASPTADHLAHAGAALEAGCHVFVEKPVAVTADGVDALCARAGEPGRVSAVGMNLRFHPALREVRRRLQDGAIGRPLTARITFGYDLRRWRPDVDYRTSYSARAEAGGGVLLDVVHELDYARWLLGEVTEVAAWEARVSDLELDVEDVVLAHLRFAGGTLATLDLDYLDLEYRRGCRIVGTRGTIEWSWRDGVVVLTTGDDRVVRAVPSDVAPTYRAELKAFLAAVRGEPADGLVGFDDALQTMRVVDAVRRSSAERRTIALT